MLPFSLVHSCTHAKITTKIKKVNKKAIITSVMEEMTENPLSTLQQLALLGTVHEELLKASQLHEVRTTLHAVTFDLGRVLDIRMVDARAQSISSISRESRSKHGENGRRGTITAALCFS